MATKTELRTSILSIPEFVHVSDFLAVPDPVPGGALKAYRLVVLIEGNNQATPQTFFVLVVDDGLPGERAYWRGIVPGIQPEPFDRRIRRQLSNVVANGATNPRTGNVIRGARILFVDPELETAEVETLEVTGATTLTRATFFVGVADNGSLDIRSIA